MILQVNKKKLENKLSPSKRSKTNEIFEDYIEVSCVRKFEGCIVAQINQTQIHLFFDKEFKRDYDSYSEDNLDFLIDSVYLLDDTGKTIKRLM